MALIGEQGEWEGLATWALDVGERVEVFHDPLEAAEALARSRRPIVACVSSSAVERVGPHGVAALKQACHPAPLVVASSRVSSESVRWLSWGIDALTPVDPSGSVDESNASHALLTSMSGRAFELTSTRRELAQRDAELSGLDALSHATAGALDADTIVHRSLTILTGMLFRPAAAFIALVGGDSDARAGLEQEETFHRLELVEQLAHDRLLVCAHPEPHKSWDELLDANAPLVFGAAPSEGAYPGLEPLWYRLRGGAAALVPVWGRTSPIGVLVLAELQPLEGRNAPLSREALRACASLLGGALENARLFRGSREAYDSLERAQDRLVRAEKFSAVGQIAAQIAHEVNNPASFVISNLSVMRDYVDGLNAFHGELQSKLVVDHPEVVEVARGLEHEHDVAFIQSDLETLVSRSLVGMQRIHRIVQDMRHFAYDAGHEPSWIELEPFLESVAHVVRPELGPRVELDLDASTSRRVHTDPNRLSQVLANLVINASHAIEASDAAGEGRVTISAREDEGAVTVVVTDSGPGIPEDQLHLVFEPFFTTKKRGQGTGLGLALSRDIMRRMGGELRASNEPGAGARFEVSVPQPAGLV